MAYVPTYQETDVAPAAIDSLVKIIAVFGTLGTIIGFVIIWILFKQAMKRNR